MSPSFPSPFSLPFYYYYLIAANLLMLCADSEKVTRSKVHIAIGRRRRRLATSSWSSSFFFLLLLLHPHHHLLCLHAFSRSLDRGNRFSAPLPEHILYLPLANANVFQQYRVGWGRKREKERERKRERERKIHRNSMLRGEIAHI